MAGFDDDSVLLVMNAALVRGWGWSVFVGCWSRRVGTTFLIVTHDPRLAARCDRVIELVDGRIDRDGSPESGLQQG